MTQKKAVIFDMDECLGSFWSLWPLYDLYVDGHITNYDKLLDITSQTILPSCLRPKLDLLLNFLNLAKSHKYINNIYIYTNNGNYQTVRERKKDKETFPHFVIKSIEKLYKLPGLFDLIFETVFIRTDDAKKKIKRKNLDDLKVHDYQNPKNIIIIDDKVNVWSKGSDRVVQVTEFRGCSTFYRNKSNVKKLAQVLGKIIDKRSKYSDNKKLTDFILNFCENEREDNFYPDTKDNAVTYRIIPNISRFIN